SQDWLKPFRLKSAVSWLLNDDHFYVHQSGRHSRHDHVGSDLLQVTSGETDPDLLKSLLVQHADQIFGKPDTDSLWQFQQLSDRGYRKAMPKPPYLGCHVPAFLQSFHFALHADATGFLVIAYVLHPAAGTTGKVQLLE